MYTVKGVIWYLSISGLLVEEAVTRSEFSIHFALRLTFGKNYNWFHLFLLWKNFWLNSYFKVSLRQLLCWKGKVVSIFSLFSSLLYISCRKSKKETLAEVPALWSEVLKFELPRLLSGYVEVGICQHVFSVVLFILL